ncbi:hypothetical protein AAHA92_13495 [Salvia divinorum]|uniref:Uncharacterized protein n=1 Tax=Salvia divinorum TaxID=28513 RepID=A0ABD1HCL3_SALDI
MGHPSRVLIHIGATRELAPSQPLNSPRFGSNHQPLNPRWTPHRRSLLLTANHRDNDTGDTFVCLQSCSNSSLELGKERDSSRCEAELTHWSYSPCLTPCLLAV